MRRKFHLNRSIASCALIIAALVFAAPHAWAENPCATVSGNLVKNCSFETGNFANWTDVPGAFADSVASNFVAAPVDGSYEAAFEDSVGNDSTLSQTLATIVGTKYTISFYLDAYLGQTPNQTIVDFGGTQVVDLENIAVDGYNEYSYTAVASSTSTVLEFKIGNNPSTTFLDDVVVAPTVPAAVPEPATWALLTSCAAVAAGLRRKQLCRR